MSSIIDAVIEYSQELTLFSRWAPHICNKCLVRWIPFDVQPLDWLRTGKKVMLTTLFMLFKLHTQTFMALLQCIIIYECSVSCSALFVCLPSDKNLPSYYCFVAYKRGLFCSFFLVVTIYIYTFITMYKTKEN